MGSALSGQDFVKVGKAHPLHACLRKVDGGTAKLNWNVWGSRKGTADVKILPQKNEPPETDGQCCAVASEPRAASAMVPWIVMEGI